DPHLAPVAGTRQRRRRSAARRAVGRISPSPKVGGRDPAHRASVSLHHGADLFRSVDRFRDAHLDGGGSFGRRDPEKVGVIHLYYFLSRVRGIRSDDDAGDPLALTPPPPGKRRSCPTLEVGG